MMSVPVRRHASLSAAANAGLRLPALTAQAQQASATHAETQRKVPFQAVMLYSRALSAQDAGRRDEAITLFSQAIDRFPDFTDAKTARARLQGGR